MKSLKKALDLIEIIGEAGSMGIRELSGRTGFPPATVHRIIAALVERGYVQQNRNSKSYSLSTRFLEFADGVQQRFDLVPIARPHLEQLSMSTGENVNLCVLDGPVVVYIDHVHSQKHVLRTFTRLGARVPLYATGVGKVYLSRMGTNELDSYLARVRLEGYTKKTITDRNALLEELSLIKERGYAVDDEEKEDGVRCVAAPVFDHRGLMAAAISVSGAAQWITPERTRPLARMVMDCAGRISADLGYQYGKNKIQ